MKALEVHKEGALSRLRLVERDIPSPGKGEVLIRVQAAGVNRADLLQVKGLYPPPPGAPDIPGLEVSGTVAALGKGVSGIAVGDEVCALLAGGGYAQYVNAPVGQVLPIPASVEMVAAASLPEACFTVWKNLYSLAKLQPGERVLIHAGASGIGVTAIQIASALGATVYATAGSAKKCAACEAFGAIKAVDYSQEDYAGTLSKLTKGQGIDVILDVLGGGEDSQKNLALLAKGGRLVTIALLSGKNTSLNLAPLLLNHITWFGSTLRSDSMEAKSTLAQSLLTHIWPLYATGRVKPVVDSIFPLEEAEAAHRYMETRQAIGKLVLKC